MTDGPALLVQKIYRETEALYARLAPEMGQAALGYRILYGPPRPCPDILFIGFQPGGRGQDALDGLAEGQHTSWPTRFEFAAAPWPLARAIRKIFGVEDLDQCTGLNLVFFRAPSMTAWRRIPRPVRKELERFSLEKCEEIVKALCPRMILVIGLGTFEALAQGLPVLRKEHSRRPDVLAREGQIWGVPAIGVAHLTGSRINRHDADRLAVFLRDKIGFHANPASLHPDM
ncbi:hypothetical protein HKD24_00220 [Gluconobacter sp. LMG 31484]|uniref:Uracil-DNA glycosylase-like domain-containing protein n=1 Tax=Gluconobacter vitians TaxID=2728102 RepID=A0ABR9Y1M0_9PROT|nr:hypothetical protein [Gluconobacter vitians]MBF0857641.1 hypothetical protein [Gluconobacter vitians]